jgi:hypothetical protein
MFAKMGPQFALLMGTLLGFLDTNLTYSSEHPRASCSVGRKLSDIGPGS